MNKGFEVKKTLILFLAVNILIIGVFGFSGKTHAFYEVEKQKLDKKIKELKRKENLEINKLTSTQKTLETTKSSISTYTDKLETSTSNLMDLQSKLVVLKSKQRKKAYSAGKRIRELYKGERINALNLIFAANDLNTFLDRVYYHKIINQKDKTVLNDLRVRAKEINRTKISAEYHKNNIAYTLDLMNRKKRELNTSIQSSQYLIEKLRTDRRTYEKAQAELEYLSNRLESKIRHSRTSKLIAQNNFIKPVVGYITSPFGWRRHPIFGTNKFHTGVDLSGPNGIRIKASSAGKVIYTGWYGGYGKVVIIDHGEMQSGSYKGQRFSTLYAHLSSINVNNGDTVGKGSVVGYEGTTGYSTGPHLHFEVRIEGKPNNPCRFVNL